jgi:hypothetical protein
MGELNFSLTGSGMAAGLTSTPARHQPHAQHQPAQVSGREVKWRFGERRWRVRVLDRPSSFHVLRVNVMCSAPDAAGGTRFHVDTLDLYSARACAVFVATASAELALDPDVVKRDLGPNGAS